VLFWDFTESIVTSYLADQGRDGTWEAITDQLEAEYEDGDAAVRELIAVSFLENLPYPGEKGADIAGHLGPALRAVLDQLR
jgi:hypothetical protein